MVIFVNINATGGETEIWGSVIVRKYNPPNIVYPDQDSIYSLCNIISKTFQMIFLEYFPAQSFPLFLYTAYIEL